MQYHFGQPFSEEETEFVTYKLSPDQRKLFGELQEAHNKFLANIKMLEKAKTEAEFAFTSFWGSVNREHTLFGKRAVIDTDRMEVRISK